MLKFKRESEEALEGSGLPYTILRPSRLTDGPYTSYDLNTLLQVGGWGCVCVRKAWLLVHAARVALTGAAAAPAARVDAATAAMQATAGSRQEVQLAPDDSLLGEASRIAVAGAS